ncbi:hypothetical protein V8J88_15460 [Massilia sp. W12]|uniref:hypothetical protein n=1 Tax=Massilia sp. W12 TaxID=3126507 RepID=UPI0030D27349
MRFVFALLALCGFLLALLLHLAALLRIYPLLLLPHTAPLLAGALLVFFAYLRDTRHSPQLRSHWARPAGNMPPWLARMLKILMLYLLLSSLPVYLMNQDATARLRDGKYYLHQGGVAREISLAEFHAFKANNQIYLSNFFMLLYAIPLAHFACAARRGGAQP